MPSLRNFARIIGNINGEPQTSTTFVIQDEEWTTEDTENLRDLINTPRFNLVVRKLHKRIKDRTEDLVNGKETRDRIDEIKDIILEFKNYEDSK